MNKVKVNVNNIVMPITREAVAPHFCLIGLSNAWINLSMMDPICARNMRASGMPMIA